MNERVGIVAVAKTKYSENRYDVDFCEMNVEVVEKVLQETGLAFANDGTGIDADVTCSSDHWDGRTISSQNAQEVVGAHQRQDEKVTQDGAAACCYAAMQILSGHVDTVLVVAHTKESGCNGPLIENFGLERNYYRMLGMDFLAAAAMQANYYMHKYNVRPEQCAQVVVKNLSNAMKNPLAQVSHHITLEEVLRSNILSSPIRLLEAKPISDGACAMILAREDKAKRFTDKPVWIKGFGMCYDTHHLGYRDLADCTSLKMAAMRAYKMAGLSDPRKEIDLVELSEYYAYQELLWSEGLGLCTAGEGNRLIDSGVTQIDGELPINPSGGLLAGVPVNVAGLDRVAEVFFQLREESGEHQVEGAAVGLAHGTSGVTGQFHCVLILEK